MRPSCTTARRARARQQHLDRLRGRSILSAYLEIVLPAPSPRLLSGEARGGDRVRDRGVAHTPRRSFRRPSRPGRRAALPAPPGRRLRALRARRLRPLEIAQGRSTRSAAQRSRPQGFVMCGVHPVLRDHHAGHCAVRQKTLKADVVSEELHRRSRAAGRGWTSGAAAPGRPSAIRRSLAARRPRARDRRRGLGAQRQIRRSSFAIQDVIQTCAAIFPAARALSALVLVGICESDGGVSVGISFIQQP